MVDKSLRNPDRVDEKVEQWSQPEAWGPLGDLSTFPKETEHDIKHVKWIILK